MNEVILETKNITKSFKISKKQQKLEHIDKPILIAVDNLSFSLKKGRIYGLLGSNGAGKTTTLRILSTLIKPDSGDVLINNISLIKNSEYARSKIGFLTSELKLEDFFTPNYLFDFFSDLHNVSLKVREERKELLFNKFGIEKFKEIKIGNLSSGMKQKVSLVISLLHDPEVIIFDEPTNGLDVITSKVVTDSLKELKDAGKTIIISTHIFSLCEKLCDDIGIIIDGRLIFEGDIKDINKHSSLEDFFFDLYKKEKKE